MSHEIPTIGADPLSPEAKERILRKKETAIRKQSPGMNEQEVLALAKDEVDNELAIWGTINVGPHWYSIEGERQEEMAKWKGQVDSIVDGLDQAMESGDFAGLAGVMKENFHQGDLKQIVEKIVADSQEHEGSFDDEAKKLLSIGLWLWREQGGAWAGERKNHLENINEGFSKTFFLFGQKCYGKLC